MNGKALRVAAASAALVLGDGTLLIASEGAHEEAPEHAVHHASVGELLFPAINFAIFAVVVVKYVIPALREYLRRRSDDIMAALAEARAALAQAEASMATERVRSASVATEGESIRIDLVTAATRHGERLCALAEETGKRRLADAALVAEQERRRALLEVRAEVAALATELAAGRLRTVLSGDDQRTFVQEFLKEAPTR